MSRGQEIELGNATHKVPTDRRQLLCLSGGGFRGLYTAIILEALELRAKRPLCNVFDVLAGSSIGGWIAAGVALQIPASTIRSGILEFGPPIFEANDRSARGRFRVRNRLRFLYRTRYRAAPVQRTIDSIFGEYGSMPLSDIRVPLVLSAVDLAESSPVILLSGGLAGQHASDMTLRDALLATSAAPSYFPIHHVGRRFLIDGGLVANAPDLVAITESIRHLGADLDRLRVLSVGTAASPHTTDVKKRASGLIQWLMQHGLVQLTLSAQEQLAVQQSAVLLRGRYHRLDYPDEGSDRLDLSLDDVSSTSINALEKAANTTISTFSTHNRMAIRRILSHHPQQARRAPLHF